LGNHLAMAGAEGGFAGALLRQSLEGADYLGDRADLDVWVDVSAGNGRADPATLLAAEQATWNHGIKTVRKQCTLRPAQAVEANSGVGPDGARAGEQVHVQNENAGLKTQWITSWNASVPGGWVLQSHAPPTQASVMLCVELKGWLCRLRKDTPEVAIILEDDMEVSKGFWRWLKSGHAKFAPPYPNPHRCTRVCRAARGRSILCVWGIGTRITRMWQG
jgi:hypothetical protein